MKFIHTSDWQIGAPFARIDDPHKRALVRQARVDVIKRVGAVVHENGAAFVVVAGDLFDSPSVDKATVAAACSAIGQMEVPVYAIPGNHDHAGPGSIWDQEFFSREREALAPNLIVLTEAEPFVEEGAVILPCPLARRSVVGDPTEWLRSPATYAGLPTDRPRIVLAHGSTQSFVGEIDDEDKSDALSNLIDVTRLPEAEIDYVALGDWHGTGQVSATAWYSGTPEADRFPKGEGYDAGNVLVVDVDRGRIPRVEKVHTGRLVWRVLSFDLADDSAISGLEGRLATLLGQRANEDLLRLTLSGAVGLEASARVDGIVESLEARLLRLRLEDLTMVSPTENEIHALTASGADPLIARVAAQLMTQAGGDGEEAATARVALRELYAAWQQERVS